MTGPSIIPTLYYRDADAAIAWLEHALGFKTLMKVPGPDGTVVHAELQLGNGLIMLGTAGNFGTSKSPLELGGVNQALYIIIDDVRAHYDRVTAAGTPIIHAYEEKDYGGAGYSCSDPEGHEWSFGSYVPEMQGEAEPSRPTDAGPGKKQ